jgi:hypothetical protein
MGSRGGCPITCGKGWLPQAQLMAWKSGSRQVPSKAGPCVCHNTAGTGTFASAQRCNRLTTSDPTPSGPRPIDALRV